MKSERVEAKMVYIQTILSAQAPVREMSVGVMEYGVPLGTSSAS